MAMAGNNNAKARTKIFRVRNLFIKLIRPA